MSDQDKKSGGSAGGSSVVMVEQSTASRHKQPYRPTDLQDEAPPDLHHKRSRAPAVPSVAEELKDSAENPDIKERRESERAISAEKRKQSVANKLSSSTKRRESSPEAIKLAPLEVETKRGGTISPSSQPIPPQVGTVASAASEIAEKIEAGKEKKDDDDSITDEIAELRTEQAKKVSEWDIENCCQKYNDPVNQDSENTVPLHRTFANAIISDTDNSTENKDDDQFRETEATVPLQRKLGNEILNDTITSTHKLKKKEISWSSATYLNKVHLQDLNARSGTWMLERKASVGPCRRASMPNGQPSGITICLPKKSLKNLSENSKPIKSGISITVSKRCFDSKSRSPMNFEGKNINVNKTLTTKKKEENLKIEEENFGNMFGNLKGKFDNLRGRIKQVMHL